MARRSIAALLAPLLVALAPGLCAQARTAQIALVEDGAGRPVPGARVTFVGTSPELPGVADTVDITADARGRAVARLVAGFGYAAWAIGPPAEDGACLVSAVDAFVPSNVPRELRAVHAWSRSTLQVTGLDAWAEAGPCRIRILPDAALPHAVALAPDAAGLVELPPLPSAGGSALLEVVDGRGEVLFGARVRIDGARTPEFCVPPPVRVPVRTVDASGAAVAGAEVRLRTRLLFPRRLGLFRVGAVESWRTAATTGEDGRATALIASTADPFANERGANGLLFRAVRRGYAEALAGWLGGRLSSSSVPTDREASELCFVLPAEAPVAGTLVPAGGAAVPRIVVRATVKMYGARSNQLVARAYEAAVGGAGSYTVAELPPTATDLSVALMPAALGEIVARLPPQRRGALPDLVPGQLPKVSVQVLDASGGPAADAVCLLVARSAVGQRDLWQPIACDPAGRFEVRATPGEWFVFAATAVAYAWQLVPIAGDLRLTLALAPFDAVRGVVRDAGGAPVAGAAVRCGGTMAVGSLAPEDQFLDAVADEIRGPLGEGVRTNGDGAFEWRLLARPNVKVTGVVRHERVSAQFEARPGESVEIRLR